MTIFTPQERRVVLLLVSTLLLGSAVKLYRSTHSESAILPSADRDLLPDTQASGSGARELDTLIKQVERAVSREKDADANELLVDVNGASEEELCLLPGIGPKLASRIVSYRETNGRFKDARDLLRVPGIGEKKLAMMAKMITFGAEEQENR